jgi:hypothetical protein
MTTFNKMKSVSEVAHDNWLFTRFINYYLMEETEALNVSTRRFTYVFNSTFSKCQFHRNRRTTPGEHVRLITILLGLSVVMIVLQFYLHVQAVPFTIKDCELDSRPWWGVLDTALHVLRVLCVGFCESDICWKWS